MGHPPGRSRKIAHVSVELTEVHGLLPGSVLALVR